MKMRAYETAMSCGAVNTTRCSCVTDAQEVCGIVNTLLIV